MKNRSIPACIHWHLCTSIPALVRLNEKPRSSSSVHFWPCCLSLRSPFLRLVYDLLLTSLKRGVQGSLKIVTTISLYGYITTSMDSVRIAVSPSKKTNGSHDDDNDKSVLLAPVRVSKGNGAQFEKHCLCYTTDVSRGAQKDV